MKKINLLFIISLITFLIISCEKEKGDNITLTQDAEARDINKEYDILSPIEGNSFEVKRILESNEFKEYDNVLFGDINLENISIMYPSVNKNAFVLEFTTSMSFENELSTVLTRVMAVGSYTEKTIKILVLKTVGKKKEGSYVAGQESCFFGDGTYVSSRLFNTNGFIFDPISNRSTMSNSEFQDCYDAKKAECESDWLCDLACSFNPCGFLYVATCAVEVYLVPIFE